MTRTRVLALPDGPKVVNLTPTQETARDAEELAYANAKPMNDWMESMQGTDHGMPRYLEDHIKDDHDGVASNEFLQTKYDEKVALRAMKP